MHCSGACCLLQHQQWHWINLAAQYPGHKPILKLLSRSQRGNQHLMPELPFNCLTIFQLIGWKGCMRYLTRRHIHVYLSAGANQVQEDSSDVH